MLVLFQLRFPKLGSPSPVVQPPNAEPRIPRPRSALKLIARTILGAVIGLPLGFLAYMLAREFILPTALWSSDRVMWAVTTLGPKEPSFWPSQA